MEGWTGKEKRERKGSYVGGMAGSAAACCDSLGNTYWSGAASRWELLVSPRSEVCQTSWLQGRRTVQPQRELNLIAWVHCKEDIVSPGAPI